MSEMMGEGRGTAALRPRAARAPARSVRKLTAVPGGVLARRPCWPRLVAVLGEHSARREPTRRLT
jgi:hypothetical protein